MLQARAKGGGGEASEQLGAQSGRARGRRKFEYGPSKLEYGACGALLEGWAALRMRRASKTSSTWQLVTLS
jgi:hypothetical protein